MAVASIPGAIVGIWGPDGDDVKTFGVADKATRRGTITLRNLARMASG